MFIHSGYLNVVALLLEHGAHVNPRDMSGQTPIDLAMRSRGLMNLNPNYDCIIYMLTLNRKVASDGDDGDLRVSNICYIKYKNI